MTLETIRADWSKLVGPQIAAISTPVDLSHGVLIITAATAEWRASLRAEERKLARTIGVSRILIAATGAPIMRVRP